MDFLIQISVVFLFLIGFIGSFLPVLPGIFIVWIGILIHRICFQEDSVSWVIVWATLCICIFAKLLDLLLVYWGAKRFGASWRGAVGAIIGGILGIFIPPPILWILIGPLIGAILLEYTNKRNIKRASRAGIGAMVGGAVAYFSNISLTIFIILFFYLSI